MNILEVTLKLLLAIALGGVIGLERESSHKPAGFRTNILICIGSTMMMILSILLLQGNETGGDLSRIAAGVITGVGFIGAGTIIQARGSVIGLTSAATIWAVAGLGLVIGAGYYLIAIIFATITIMTLVLFRRFEVEQPEIPLYRYSLKTKYSDDMLINIKKLAIHEGIKFKEFAHKDAGNITLLDFSFHAPEEKEQRFKWSLLNLDGLLEIKIE